jgi:hypothetical protein
MEKNLVGIALSAGGAVAGGKYLFGLPPLIDLTILGGAGYIGKIL